MVFSIRILKLLHLARFGFRKKRSGNGRTGRRVWLCLHTCYGLIQKGWAMYQTIETVAHSVRLDRNPVRDDGASIAQFSNPGTVLQ